MAGAAGGDYLADFDLPSSGSDEYEYGSEPEGGRDGSGGGATAGGRAPPAPGAAAAVVQPQCATAGAEEQAGAAPLPLAGVLAGMSMGT